MLRTKSCRVLVCWVAMAALCLCASAQKIFDPTLDPEVKVLPSGSHELWEGSAYMWYPGQLAAYRQQWLREQSKARCMDVGYVGKFNPMQEVTWFKVQLVAKDSTPLEYAAAGSQGVEITDNGKPFTGHLLKGKHELVFTVTTRNQLPALMVQHSSQFSIVSCQSSLDGKTWMPVETDSRYNNPEVNPNVRINDEVVLLPKDIIPLKNVKDKTQLHHNGSIIYDFWYDEVGTIEVEASGSGKLHFTVGESIEEVMNASLMWR